VTIVIARRACRAASRPPLRSQDDADAGARVVSAKQAAARFEAAVLPHLDAAYNLARWILRNDNDAQDVTQEACARAFQYWESFRGGDARAWLLAIVRRACYSWLDSHRPHAASVPFEEERHSDSSYTVPGYGSPIPGPQEAWLRKVEQDVVSRCLEALPLHLREILVLRELEEMSYKDLCGVLEVPVGTVMSRLARARARMRELLQECES
jgi:RNA polymerase sigma-70 factor, ECF subfamily